jgi:glycerol-3-phosphate acyltransferase PlsY
MILICIAILSYLIGSIPFGLLLTRAAGLGDIRSIGSGNIGATNVLRTGNKKLAAATLILDGAKGAVAVALAHHFVGENAALTAGAFSILGHIFPVWLKFKGGKGVATTLGMLLVLAPWTGLIACATWLTMAFTLRISSLSALTALALTPITSMLIYEDTRLSIICLLVAILVFYTHRANIRRLIKGEEPKIGKKK